MKLWQPKYTFLHLFNTIYIVYCFSCNRLVVFNVHYDNIFSTVWFSVMMPFL